MLDDLFSHKIHATDLEEWAITLVRLAEVYFKFDKCAYNSHQLENELHLLAPNSSRSAFRDQFSIYMSILGVGQIVWEQGAWRVHLSETARIFLLGPEPDTEAFCRLQLALYQRPDGRGLSYRSTGVHEHSSWTEKIELIRNGYRVCPFRLILQMIGGKALYKGIAEDQVEVSKEEIYAFANDPVIRAKPTHALQIFAEGFERFNRGRMVPVPLAEGRLKFLEGTGLVAANGTNITLMDRGDRSANSVRDRQVHAIRSLGYFFDRFHQCTDREGMVEEIKARHWARYFDAVRTLSPLQIDTIANHPSIAAMEPLNLVPPAHAPALPPAPQQSVFAANLAQAQKTPQQITNPETTRIRRERRNAYHNLILQRLGAKIRAQKLEPCRTSLIDLFTNVDSIRQKLRGQFSTRGSYLESQNLPYFPSQSSDELSFLFEAKSADENIYVDQVRRAVGQLYEYRYRYSHTELKRHVILVVALQQDMGSFRWLANYLLHDRHIAVCWLDNDLQRILCPRECMPVLQPFVDGIS